RAGAVQVSTLHTPDTERFGVRTGCSPVVRSMIARRRAPIRAQSWPTICSPSGPRCASAAAIAGRQSACLSGAPRSETAPKIPHITSPALPTTLGRLWRVWGSGRLAGPVRRVAAIVGDQRQYGELGPRFAIRDGRDEHRGNGAMSERLAPVPLGQERRAAHVPVTVLVVGDIVARELRTRRRRHGYGSSEVEGKRRRIRQDAQHGARGAGPARLAERSGRGARQRGRRAVVADGSE